MKTFTEKRQLEKMAFSLNSFLREAGFNVYVEYENTEEKFVLIDLNTKEAREISCRMSSLTSCATDVFRQGVNILDEILENL